MSTLYKINSYEGLELIAEDMEFPHMQRETNNNFVFNISNVSVWRKISPKQEEYFEGPSPMKRNMSESDEYEPISKYNLQTIQSISEHCHFGQGLFNVPNFPQRIGQLVIDSCKKYKVPFNKVLDCGTGPGATSIKLARAFKQVDAFDFIQEFVNILKKQSRLNNFKNIKAFVDDANSMKNCGDGYSCIIACNLIDRLKTPKEFIKLAK